MSALRKRWAARSMAPPWQTWRSRLPLTISYTKKSRRTAHSSALVLLAARWTHIPACLHENTSLCHSIQRNTHRSSWLKLVIKSSPSICIFLLSCPLGEIYSLQETVQQSIGKFSWSTVTEKNIIVYIFLRNIIQNTEYEITEHLLGGLWEISWSFFFKVMLKLIITFWPLFCNWHIILCFTSRVRDIHVFYFDMGSYSYSPQLYKSFERYSGYVVS